MPPCRALIGAVSRWRMASPGGAGEVPAAVKAEPKEGSGGDLELPAHSSTGASASDGSRPSPRSVQTAPCGCVTLAKPSPCPHARMSGVADNLATASEYIYTIALHLAAKPKLVTESSESQKQEPFTSLRCFHCGTAGPLSACLQCFYVGCRQHAGQHLQESGHNLMLDCTVHKVRCRMCRGFVHDSELESHLERGRKAVITRFRKLAAAETAPSKNKRAANMKPSLPTGALLREKAHAAPAKASILGLRGMTNMGNTCFMSSVLQALVHTPFLRNVFLSDSEWSPTRIPLSKCDTALRDDFSRLFASMYCGETTPHAPFYLLYTVWKQATALAGYAQQDAHEFLSYVLNQLHSQMLRGTSSASVKSDCNVGSSIVSRVFQGKLRSDVTCCDCGTISTKRDHFFDLQLDLGSSDIDETHTSAVDQKLPATTDTSAEKKQLSEIETANDDTEEKRESVGMQVDTSPTQDASSSEITPVPKLGLDVTQGGTPMPDQMWEPPPPTPRAQRLNALSLEQCLSRFTRTEVSACTASTAYYINVAIVFEPATHVGSGWRRPVYV